MALRAMGFCKLPSPRLSAPDVLLLSDGLHVRRVDAKANPAEVVDLEAFWNRAYQEFVGEAVGKHVATSHIETPITVGPTTCGP